MQFRYSNLRRKLVEHYDRHCRTCFQGDKLVEEITDICIAAVGESLPWATAEIQSLRQEIEELKIDLMMAENLLVVPPDMELNTKAWRNTKHDKSDPY